MMRDLMTVLVVLLLVVMVALVCHREHQQRIAELEAALLEERAKWPSDRPLWHEGFQAGVKYGVRAFVKADGEGGVQLWQDGAIVEYWAENRWKRHR